MKNLFWIATLCALACLMPRAVLLNKAAADEGDAQFFFAVNSGGGNTADRINLNGAGTFGIGFVRGGGTFTRLTPTETPPFPIVYSGSWRATEFLSFSETPGSPYGQVISGILTMQVELRPTGLAPIAATMEVVCNTAAGGLFTGEDEGVKLTLSDGTTFGPIGQGQTIISPGRLADNDGDTRFFFEVVSGDGNTADRINLSGAGTFAIGRVTGGGSFTRFTPTGTAPFPIVDSGIWRANKFLSFTETPGSPYGQGISGILTMQVELRPLGKQPVAATMQVVCNLGAGALDTGEDEGVKLALSDGTRFAPIGQGQTIFNLGHDDD
jgi:hypothetical protein